MTFKLRDRILGWSIASTVVIVVAVLFLVDSFFRTTIRATLEEGLVSSARLAVELRGSRVDGWIGDVGRMALEPTLRAAVSTGDPATVDQILDELRASSGADWIAVASPEGELLAGSGPVPGERLARASRLLEETAYFDSGDLWRDGAGLVDVGASSVYFGQVRLGTVVAGLRLGRERAGELATFTGQRVAILEEGAEPGGDDAGGLRDVPWGEDADAAHPSAAAAPWPVRAFRLEGESWMGTALPLRDAERTTVGRIVLYRSLDAAYAPARRLRLALLAIGAGGLVLGLLFSVALTRSVTSPLRTLLGETERLGAGRLDEPIRVRGGDEIGQLAEGFERMRVSLAEAREEVVRRERLSAVGRAASSLVHDFSQPVLVISGHAELLGQGWEDPEARREDLAAIAQAVERIQRMMREVLEFARGETRLDPAPTEVAALLDEVASHSRPATDAAGIRLEVGHGYPGRWVLDRERTARALGNLVRNAAALTPPPSTIQLRSFRVNGSLRLEVEDDGPGIPGAIRSSLFEPFVSRGKSEGTGLGLAIVKNIAESQGGSVTFETSPAGTTFVLALPDRPDGGAA